MAARMNAVEIAAPGGPEVLQLTKMPVPEPAEGEVLISVRAAGVNRPDVLQRLGLYPLPPGASPLPGLEVAGVVERVGPGVSLFAPGDRVMALTHGGGYAEMCVAHESHCLPVPQDMSDIEAAAIPETFFTVYYNVFTRGMLRPGETLLVHGGSSGIGTTAIQLARAWCCNVIVTAGSDEKCGFCTELGANGAINYRTEDWVNRCLELNEGSGPDVILDMVAGSYMQKNLDLLARDGRYVIIAFLQGPKAELDMRAVLGKRLTITGSTLRPQSIEEKGEIASNLRQKVLPLLESGEIKPIIYDSFTLAEAASAHALMESSAHMGKIVLTVGS